MMARLILKPWMLILGLITIGVVLIVTPGLVKAEVNSRTVGWGSTFTHGSGVTGGVGGDFTLDQFVVIDKKLQVEGDLNLSLCLVGVDPKNCLASVNQFRAFEVAQLSGTCEQLHVETAPVDITDPSLPDYIIHMPALSFDVVPGPDSPEKMSKLLCNISHRLNGNAPLKVYDGVLNKLFSQLP